LDKDENELTDKEKKKVEKMKLMDKNENDLTEEEKKKVERIK
jgi:hypothetical protein